jgi:hypothetical protein
MGRIIGQTAFRDIPRNRDTYLLEMDPDSALNEETAGQIAVTGLRHDLFTGRGRKLEDVIGSNPTLQEFIEARTFVNSYDDAPEIAKRAMGYYDAMKGSCF